MYIPLEAKDVPITKPTNKKSKRKEDEPTEVEVSNYEIFKHHDT